MRYEGNVFRPPSEADSWILQATLRCSWNACTYCDMYRAKRFRVRPLGELFEEVAVARRVLGPRVDKVFVADGDALVMDLGHWEPLLRALREGFPRLRRVSAYAMAGNLLDFSISTISPTRSTRPWLPPTCRRRSKRSCTG